MSFLLPHQFHHYLFVSYYVDNFYLDIYWLKKTAHASRIHQYLTTFFFSTHYLHYILLDIFIFRSKVLIVTLFYFDMKIVDMHKNTYTLTVSTLLGFYYFFTVIVTYKNSCFICKYPVRVANCCWNLASKSNVLLKYSN